ncbi:MAG TPA: glycosyltransferase family 2 protein [Clostridiales bacterium]|nr:glycosyltransferase family 2 protein [Clostridiales bacterium]
MQYTSKDHTFVVCAYKESEFLEKCIISVLNQNVKSNVILSTSTPNEFIMKIANKYNLKVHINNGIGDQADNFNFAYSQVETELVTICHQDDYYSEFYLENAFRLINKARKPLIFFTNYIEDRGNEVVKSNTILKVKRFLLFPLRFWVLWGNVFIRTLILSLGDPICCPSVTFVKSNISAPIFNSIYKGTLDWRAWIKISKKQGQFIYSPKTLTVHRIHNESGTTEIIINNIRSKEELEIFKLFWPDWIAKKLSRIYASSQNSNNI